MNTEKSEHLPKMSIFVGDWRKHPGIQALNYHDRGVWHEILLLMHESDQRGILLLNGKPMPDEALARLLGLDRQVLVKTINTLTEYGVTNRNSDGALYCEWMIKEERIRLARKKAGEQGGNPNLIKGKQDLLNQNPTKRGKEVKQKSTLSVSSSISNSNTENNHPAHAREPSDSVKKLILDETQRIEIQSALDWVMEQKQVTELFYEEQWISLFILLERNGIDLEEFRRFFTWLDAQTWVDFVEPPLMRQQIEAWKKREKIEAKKSKPQEKKNGNGSGNNSGQAGAGKLRGSGPANRAAQSDNTTVH